MIRQDYTIDKVYNTPNYYGLPGGIVCVGHDCGYRVSQNRGGICFRTELALHWGVQYNLDTPTRKEVQTINEELIITPETVEQAAIWFGAGIDNANDRLEALLNLSALGKIDPEQFRKIVANDGNAFVHDLLMTGLIISHTTDMYLGNTSTTESDDIMKAIEKTALKEAEDIYPS